MNIGVITVAFNEERFIGPCIKQFDGFNFPHLIMVSSKPWRGEYEMDNTWILSKMYINNGEVIVGDWPSQADQFNEALSIFEFEGIDWALIVDADEFYTTEDIGRLVGQIRTTEYDAILANRMEVYWKTPEYKIASEQLDYPAIAIKTSKRFRDKRSVESNVITTNSKKITLHHMSYVRSDEDMLKKIHSFEHSHEFDLDSWYKNKWLTWEWYMYNKNRDLHPTVPSKFNTAIGVPAPKEIQELIKWDS